jgi:RecA/RadA recombinase
MTELKRRKLPTEDQVIQTAEEMTESVDEDPIPRENIKEENLISTGSTILNLACSGFSPYGGFMLGSVVHIIGDSQAGKSLLALTMMAEAAINSKLSNYKLIYEEPEAAMYFPAEEMFGKGISRVDFIPKDEDRINARRVQDWSKDLINAEHPFIWVTDSFDSLTSEDDLKRDESTKGGWKTEKAIVASETFPKIIGPLKANNSLYMHISQTRDNLGVTFGETKTFGGGNAIRFYRCHEIWLAVKNLIYKEIRGEKVEIGANVLVKIKKNKLTGKVRFVDFSVYNDYGIDDVGSMIDWMVKKKFWNLPKGKQIIETEDGFIDATRPKLIDYVEENNLEDKLKKVVAECWLELEGEIATKRKPRY